MTPTRRALLAGPALAAMPSALRAQAPWPARPVRVVVPFTPAGTTDVAARILAERLQSASASPSRSRTGPAPAATWAPTSSPRPSRTATRC